MRIVAVIVIAMGVVLSGIGISMCVRQNASEVVQGDKGTSAIIGAAGGAVVGGGAGALLGGVGIAACGTGIGIPAGVVSLLCAGACSLITGASGYIVGKPDTIIVESVPPYVYWSVIIAGCLLVVMGIVCFSRTIKRRIDEGCLMDK